MQSTHGGASTFTILVSSLLSIAVTLCIVAFALIQYGVEPVAKEVSPFVEEARKAIVSEENTAGPKSEADTIMDAVAKNQGSSVLIYANDAPDAEFLGRGIVVSTNGTLITDAHIIAPDVVSASSTYSVSIPGTKERLTATVLKVENKLAVLKVTLSTSLVATFTNDAPLVGDLVAGIHGNEKMSIGTGIITNVQSTTVVTNIYGTMTPGSALVSKNGAVLGVAVTGEQKLGEAVFTRLTKDSITSLLSESGS